MQQKKMKYSEELKKRAPEMSRTSGYIFLKNRVMLLCRMGDFNTAGLIFVMHSSS